MLDAQFQHSPPRALAQLAESGCALLSPAGLSALVGAPLGALEPLRASWSRLPPDGHLRDGGAYRSRRHACFTLDPPGGDVVRVPHRAHWQPVDYNALHGGIERWFEPVEGEVAALPGWTRLIAALGAGFAALQPAARWFVEAHQFRIDTAGGIGRPTPEGAHRDGVGFVAITLIDRQHIKGGETRVFEAQGPQGVRFTLVEPFQTLLLDDARVIHETSPIQPAGELGHRDTLVLTFRAGGFQSPRTAAG